MLEILAETVQEIMHVILVEILVETALEILAEIKLDVNNIKRKTVKQVFLILIHLNN